jgi:hypothetical protein
MQGRGVQESFRVDQKLSRRTQSIWYNACDRDEVTACIRGRLALSSKVETGAQSFFDHGGGFLEPLAPFYPLAQVQQH